ncbi:MAG: diacylglycerol kinase family lipid kinase [Candidatus Latescibacterota bacterium]|nr:MAG: diacylglycerol kinase family lipid kinase [Candidatus Latescibacterota bacterium]
MPSFKRILVIVNPTAGQRNISRIRSRIEAFFMEKGYDFTLRDSEQQGDTLRWSRSASAEGFDLVAVVGGDGTVREATDGIMRSGGRIPLAQIPAGTTNFVARALSIPTGIHDALNLVETGKVDRFDIGYLPEHDRYFVFVVGTGYDAKLIHETPAPLKRKLGFLAYVATGFRHALSVQPVRMELEIDDQVKHLRAHTVMAVNIGSIASLGFSFAPNIDPHDGKLNVEIMSTRSLWGSMLVILKILTKRYHGFADLKHTQARRIRVTSDPPFPVEVDGDPMGTTPFLAEVLPDAMQFLVPQDYAPPVSAGSPS